jgi:hypothetical protein
MLVILIKTNNQLPFFDHFTAFFNNTDLKHHLFFNGNNLKLLVPGATPVFPVNLRSAVMLEASEGEAEASQGWAITSCVPRLDFPIQVKTSGKPVDSSGKQVKSSTRFNPFKSEN